MAASETAIVNSALAKVGAQRILSLDDNNERAKIMKEQYNKVRDELLFDHPWRFAITRVELAEVTPVPTFQWAHKFQLPTDCLRVIETDLPKGDMHWAVEDRFLMCQYDTVMIAYIKQVTDVSKFSPGFSELLAIKLAADVAYSLTQSSTLRDSLLQEYNMKIREQRTFSAQETAGRRVYSDGWLNSRS